VVVVVAQVAQGAVPGTNHNTTVKLVEDYPVQMVVRYMAAVVDLVLLDMLTEEFTLLTVMPAARE
jgi:hypothetical protein